MSAVEQKADVVLLFSMLEGDVKIPKEIKWNNSDFSCFWKKSLLLTKAAFIYSKKQKLWNIITT